MRTIRADRFLLEAHKEQAVLYHYTTADRVEGIRKNGILPSSFGDIVIDAEDIRDGAGVYAVSSPTGNDALIAELQVEGGTVMVVEFLSCGVWYRVARDFETENGGADDAPVDHTGYVLHPRRVPPGNILGIREV